MEDYFVELDALTALVLSSVNDIKAEYTKLSAQLFPSLDERTPHLLDSHPSVALGVAQRTLYSVCSQLLVQAVNPAQAIILHFESTALRLALRCKIADQLQDHPDGLHVSQIAAQSKVEKGKLARMLRFLATKHIFREVKMDMFTNNRLSVQLISGNPAGSFDRRSVLLRESLRRDASGPGLGTIKQSGSTAFARYYGHSMWDFLTKVDRVRGQRFMSAMTGLSNTQNIASMLQGFPWKELPAQSSVCDVGGGVGHMSAQIGLANPKVKVFLQDRGNVLNEAKTFFAENAQAMVEENRVNFVEIDFLKGSPVANCDVYFAKHIIHDWPDEDARSILSNIKKVMKPSSRLLVQEYISVHPSRDPDDDTGHFIPPAPAPLLPNWGSGRLLQYRFDVSMMALFNSMERTLAEYRKLGQDVGLELEKVWDCCEMYALEFKLRRV